MLRGVDTPAVQGRERAWAAIGCSEPGRAGRSLTLRSGGVDKRPPEESHPARLSFTRPSAVRQPAPASPGPGRTGPADSGEGAGGRGGAGEGSSTAALARGGGGAELWGERGRAAAGGRGRRQGNDRGSRAARSGSLCPGESPPADTPTASWEGVGEGIAHCGRRSPAGRGLRAEEWG